MLTSLPGEFTQKMQNLLGEEYSSFTASYTSPRSQGLRANPLKVQPSELPKLLPFSLRPIPWCSEGFYYSPQDRPGKHPYHAAGLYYIQEPSAMAVVEALDPKPGEKILDLSAAPGGKATQIGARLQGRGILVANEIVPNRAKILAENLERFGVTNALVLNEHPQKLSTLFPGYFDRILVDAPCSGEGMFRKEPEVCSEWSLENVAKCASRQLEILEFALKMLRPGGTLVYSTCTFSPEENEQVIEQLLLANADLKLETAQVSKNFAPGRPEWASGNETLLSTMRLWPHLLEGEGHFVALLRRSEGISATKAERVPDRANKVASSARRLPAATKEAISLWQEFANINLELPHANGEYIQFAEYLYLLPQGLPDMTGVKIARPGWLLGAAKKNRFEPGHALALGIDPNQSKRAIFLSANSAEVFNYLRGETLNLPGEKGWTLVTVDGFPLGWGKHDGATLKNHYPKGLRW